MDPGAVSDWSAQDVINRSNREPLGFLLAHPWYRLLEAAAGSRTCAKLSDPRLTPNDLGRCVRPEDGAGGDAAWAAAKLGLVRHTGNVRGPWGRGTAWTGSVSIVS
jgi:hypothetical protein